MSLNAESSRQQVAITRAQALLTELARHGVDACDIRLDTRQLQPGMVFAALPGVHGDGRDHLAAALAQQVAAVLWEAADGRACQPELAAQVAAAGVLLLPVAQLGNCLGELAARLHDEPSRNMWLCGITGTNGKTTTSQWLAQLLGCLGRPCGVIGTLGSGLPGALEPGKNTTPDVCSLHATLARLRRQGAQACAMEVSSIGIDQGRVDGVCFDTAVFTNLSRDHLEYHHTMEAYAAAKARLFAWPDLQSAVLNLDDGLGRQLAEDLAGCGVQRIGYGLSPATAATVPVERLLCPEGLRLDASGMSFTLDGVAFKAPVLGRYNVANLLAVIGALLAAGHTLAEIAPLCAGLTPPPGRLQQVRPPAHVQAPAAWPLVVVDYAHTPDALEQTLKVLRELADAHGGRLYCLFGCGGDRDPGKRPLMGELAERLADGVLLTSDNPRSESPQAIIADILRGMQSQPRVELDRGVAIELAVARLESRDVLLIAGKGHEDYQEVAGVRRPFSDLQCAAVALGQWRAPTC